MTATQKEIQTYCSTLSKQIFHKPLNQLTQTQLYTLHLSITMSRHYDNLDYSTYTSLTSYLKNKRKIWKTPKPL